MRILKYATPWSLAIMVTLLGQPAICDSVLPLPGNPDALVSGTRVFSATDGSRTLNANVNYAVFGPGVFDNIGGVFGRGTGGYDPLTDYVYAYQIENTGDTVVSSLQLTVGLLGDFTDLGEDPIPSGGISPLIITPIGAISAGYIFTPTPFGQIGNGKASTVLLLSSEQPWIFAQAALVDSGLTATALLPVPGIPLPPAAWLGLAMFGVLGAITVSRKRLAR